MLTITYGSLAKIHKYTDIEHIALASNTKGYLISEIGTTFEVMQLSGLATRRELIDKCKTRKLKLGDVVQTSAGNLPYKSILHTMIVVSPVGYVNFESVRATAKGLKKYCLKNGITKFATTLLGVSSFNLSYEAVLDIFKEIFEDSEDIECVIVSSARRNN